MTLTQFVAKNAFRNKRRSIMTVISVGFSLLLLTLMMSIWRSFYIDQGAPNSALRLITRHRVSLTFSLPGYYREKIRQIPGVTHVVPVSWFGGKYKNDKPGNFFAQFFTDPEEITQVETDWKFDSQQLKAWQGDRAGAAVDSQLAAEKGWKLGDRITLIGTIFPINPELTIRMIYDSGGAGKALYFHKEYVEQGVAYFKGQAGTFAILVDSPQSVGHVAAAVDEMFHNAPQQTKTESEKSFQLGFIAMLGNVKAFILSISLAVVFAILLVSANTMAMSVRERTREVAVLKTLGFTRRGVLALFVGEAVALSLAGGCMGVLLASLLIGVLSKAASGTMLGFISVGPGTLLVSLTVAAMVGFVSAFLPSYRASALNIAEGLRHLG